jgi:hypothetical protein
MASFLIQMVKFEFERATWTNQELSRRYSPPALRTDDSMGATN